MNTPTPRSSAAIIASGFQAVPEGFRAFAGNLERELATITAERDQLRAELAAERARLDYLLQWDVTFHDRADIDAELSYGHRKKSTPTLP